MGKDSPDGLSRLASSGYGDLIQQLAMPYTYYTGANLGAGVYATLGYQNLDSSNLGRVRGWRIYSMDESKFRAYLYFGAQGWGYYQGTTLLEVWYPENVQIVCDYGDSFTANVTNLDSVTRYLRMYVFYEKIVRPVGWIHRPTAKYSVDDSTPAVGQSVAFTDESLYTPTYWHWDFGDGSTSNEQNPNHAYSAAGIYTIVLVVRNAGGTDVKSATVVVG
ncbi:MAG: PKD domain-containing protein [Acidobacteria bacterium]|nr:PKD domain-containing protein [Acidobacteriota bacterium]